MPYYSGNFNSFQQRFHTAQTTGDINNYILEYNNQNYTTVFITGTKLQLNREYNKRFYCATRIITSGTPFV